MEFIHFVYVLIIFYPVPSSILLKEETRIKWAATPLKQSWKYLRYDMQMKCYVLPKFVYDLFSTKMQICEKNSQFRDCHTWMFYTLSCMLSWDSACGIYNTQITNFIIIQGLIILNSIFFTWIFKTGSHRKILIAETTMHLIISTTLSDDERNTNKYMLKLRCY